MREITEHKITKTKAQEIFDKASEFDFNFDLLWKANTGFEYGDVRFVDAEYKKTLVTKESEFLDVSKINFPEEFIE